MKVDGWWIEKHLLIPLIKEFKTPLPVINYPRAIKNREESYNRCICGESNDFIYSFSFLIRQTVVPVRLFNQA